MKINIDKLTENELIDLNHRIVERLKFLRSARDHTEMMEYSIGEKVCFNPHGRGAQIGVIAKYNKKTVTIITENGERWNVSPSFLTQANDKTDNSNKKSNVIELRKIK
jgi:hypothetical protein